jgi:predicted KAP-like P-loop ATPase
VINSDTPIKAKKDDLLNRSKFASSLGKSILDWKNEEGIVIGLYGKWGSGKSSVINLALEDIERITSGYKEEDKPIVVRFNPWNFTEQDQLLSIFFSELAKAINYYDKGEDAKIVGKKLITYSKFFTVLGLIPPLNPFTSVVEKVLKKVGVATESWGELQTKSLDRYKAELDNSIRKLDRKIIIIVDDIDRLNEKEVKQIFQLVKLNANFPNTSYLLALDVAQVKEDTEFLEKIIQVGFHIPAVEEIRLRKVLYAELDKILKPYPKKLWSPERWNRVFNDGYKDLFGSLRKVKRYINSLRFNINVISSEINPLDFFVIEAIRVFYPLFYDEVARNKELIVGRTFLDNDRDRGARKQQFESLFESIKDKKDREIIRGLMFNLFPQIDAVYRNQTAREEADWFKEKRICSRERFGNYFYLALSEGEISQQEMNIIIGASGDTKRLSEILEKLLKDGRIRRCLERLPEFIDEVPSKNVYTFIWAFFNVSDRISRQRDSDIDFGPDIQIVRLAYHLIKKLPKKKRLRVLKDLINNSVSVDAPAHFVSFQQETNKKQPEDQIVNDAELSELAQLALKRIKTAAKNGELVKSPGFAYLLYRWRDWADISEPKKYVEEITNTPQGIAALLEGFTAQSISGYKRNYRLSFKDLKAMADLKALKNKVSKLSDKDKKSLDKKQKERIKDFMKGVDKAIAGKEDFF